jgi:hypothetical protein
MEETLMDRPSYKLPLAILAVFVTVAVAVMIATIGHTVLPAHMQEATPDWECTDMNGNEIHPEPDLCNWTCKNYMESPHMQAHLDETCRCCKARGIDYSQAKEYQPRVYVVNSDGSQGEDRTCAYYPEAAGCS